jgi:hypothetical protein
MIQKLKTPVSATLFYDHRTRKVMPQTVIFDGREYRIVKVGLHHTFREGKTLFHVFSVASEAVFFRLVLNTENLFWTLEEISDGEAD